MTTETEPQKALKEYIHILEQLRQTTLMTILPEVAATIEANLQAAHDHLEFLENPWMKLGLIPPKKR